MTRLLSGSTLRRGGSGEFLDLAGAQPQLPTSPSTSTGFTLVTDNLLRSSYRSSLGNIQMHLGTMYSNISGQDIRIIGTGTGVVKVEGGAISTSAYSGALQVIGDIGIAGKIFSRDDIIVNGLTIGQGYFNTIGGMNNIVIRNTATAQLNEFDVGQENIVIGYSALTRIDTAYRNIAIGRYALSSGTQLSNSIAIGDGALANIGTVPVIVMALIDSITLGIPVSIVAFNHGLTTGDQILILDVLGTTDLNTNYYYVNVIDIDTIELYTDIILSVPLDGTSFAAYDNSIPGTINIATDCDNNYAIGHDAGKNLINGKENFFLGFKNTPGFTTGSYNLIMGHQLGTDFTHGNSNISIGGDNLVSGLDNQINIGAVFYYNGTGFLSLSADTAMGYGTIATDKVFSSYISAATNTDPVQITSIAHGLYAGDSIFITSVLGMPQINDQKFYVDYIDPDNFNLYYDIGLTLTVDGTFYGTYISSGTIYVNQLFGALTVLGGISVTDNAIINGNVVINNTASTTSTATGALTVAGGVGIGKNLYVGGIITATNMFIGPWTVSTDSSQVVFSSIPTTSSSTGIRGQLAASTTSLYVCVSTDTWIKIVGTTF